MKTNKVENRIFLPSISTTFRQRRAKLTFSLMTAASCLAVAGLATGSMAQELSTGYEQVRIQHPDWVQVPGELIRPDCVHQVPSGATVKAETTDDPTNGDVTLNGKLVAHYAPCPEKPFITRRQGRSEKLLNAPQAFEEGLTSWVEASEMGLILPSTDNIDYVSGDWRVPSNPSNPDADGLIYLFNGVSSSERSWILQPVLQWGWNQYDGGHYWGISSWMFGTDNNVYKSPLEPVNPGDLISGYTLRVNTVGDKLMWRVQATDDTTKADSWIEVLTWGQHWTWAYGGVLEAYRIEVCTDFPANGRTTFTGSVVDHGFPKFESVSLQALFGSVFGSFDGPACGFSVTVGANGDSTLAYVDNTGF
jgi:hypothetical protein